MVFPLPNLLFMSGPDGKVPTEVSHDESAKTFDAIIGKTITHDNNIKQNLFIITTLKIQYVDLIFLPLN